MFKLALDSGHGLHTAGKRCLKSLDPNETREWWLNNRICNKIQDKLSSYEGIEILRVDDISGAIDVPRLERCERANKWGADYYLSMHHNAGIYGGTGGGFLVFRYSKLSENGETAKKQKILCEELIKAGVSKGNRSSNIATAEFDVLRYTDMPAALIEAAFMDSSVDVPLLLTDDFAERVALGCVNAIVRFGNLQKKNIEELIELPKVEEPIEDKPELHEPTVEELPDIEDIFQGKMPSLPRNTDALYALTAAMTAYARKYKDDMSLIANSIRYAERMPPDFSVVLMRDYMYIEEGYKERLLNIPEFSKWLSSKGGLLNGAIR